LYIRTISVVFIGYLYTKKGGLDKSSPYIQKGAFNESNPCKPALTSIINNVDLINQAPTKEARPNSTNKLRLYE